MSSPQPQDPVTPIPPDAPAFNPLDPISITWYVTAVVTVLGFMLKKDLTAYAGPVSMGLFAAVGIAMGVIRAIKHRTYNVALQQYNSLRLDHAKNTSLTTVMNALRVMEGDVRTMKESLAAPVKRTPAKKTTRSRRKPPPI